MASKNVDLKAVLSRLNEQSKRGGGGDKTYMELEQGDNVVRILPAHPNMDTFFTEVFYHRKEQGKKSYQVICLNNGDSRAGECPVCEALEELRTSRDKGDKALFGKQRPKQRFFMNVIDRADGEVKILATGITVMKKILQYATDEDEYGDILDLQDGTDLIINRQGDGLDTEYDVKARRKTSPAFEDKKTLKKTIGTSADDTKLFDLTEQANQFQGEPDKVMLVWEDGWDALKEEDDEEKPKKKGKKSKKEDEEEDEEEEAPKAKAKKKAKPAPVEEDEDEEEEEKPKAKKPAKKAKPEPEEEDEEEEEEERPKAKSKSKAKSRPEPEEEDEDEEEEEKPKSKAKKKAKPADDDEEDDDEDGLGSLDDVLKQHRAKAGKKGK